MRQEVGSREYEAGSREDTSPATGIGVTSSICSATSIRLYDLTLFGHPSYKEGIAGW